MPYARSYVPPRTAEYLGRSDHLRKGEAGILEHDGQTARAKTNIDGQKHGRRAPAPIALSLLLTLTQPRRAYHNRLHQSTTRDRESGRQPGNAACAPIPNQADHAQGVAHQCEPPIIVKSSENPEPPRRLLQPRGICGIHRREQEISDSNISFAHTHTFGQNTVKTL